MGEAKIKINLKEGTFEIEGSEIFVEKYWEKLKTSLEKIPIALPMMPVSENPITTHVKSKSQTKNKTQKKPSFELIPLDLESGDNNKPSLKQLYEQKSPLSHQEIITFFSYYLTKYLGINNMQYGHALFCYTEIQYPKPTNIAQLFRNTCHRQKWLESGDEVHTVKLSIAGENLIDHKLPRSKTNT